MSATRRQLLARGAGAAGAAVVPSVLLAAPAFAQESDETDELESLIKLEQAAALGYEQAAEVKGIRPELKQLFEQIRTQEDEHDAALSSAIDQLAVDPPEPSDKVADYDSLDGIEQANDEKKILDFMISVEEDLLSAYLAAAAKLEASDLIRTGAQIGGSHSQHLVVLRFHRGDSPEDAAALPGP